MIDYSPLLKKMKKLHLSFSDLKRITGVSDGAIRSDIYNGKYLKTSTLATLCDKLECEINELITWKRGQQQPLPKPFRVQINWELLKEKLARRNLTVSNAIPKIIHRSINDLTKKRKEGKGITIEVAMSLARFCHVDYYEFVLEDYCILMF